MKLRRLKIQNFRSAYCLDIKTNNLHAIVGANNSGKSTILKAIDLLINPSTKKVDEEAFWNKDLSNEIRIEAIFKDLDNREIEQLSSYLKPDQSFHIARTAHFEPAENSNKFEDGKIVISQHYCKPVPKYDWLVDDKINGISTKNWWSEKEKLSVNGNSFVEFVGNSKPNVGDWKNYAQQFVSDFLGPKDFEEKWIDNPRGYAGVLQGILPNYIFIPAVKDITDEAKVTKSNPFGSLLNQLLENISDAQKNELGQFLSNIDNRLNRKGGNQRIDSIQETETKLNTVLKNYMPVDLEIEFESPTIEILLSTPKLFADDGFRNSVENKGHGLQRAIIFSILQSYSELIAIQDPEYSKTTIFGIEEPEIYMHPQAQRNIRNVFKTITAGKDQILFSTHSPNLVDVTYFDEIIRVEARIEDHSIKSYIWQLPIQRLIDDLVKRIPALKGKVSENSIRDLYSHAYHPARSEGFFAKKIILVEGATEQYAFPIYASALNINLDRSNVSVVDCGGKGQIDRLYRIFNELGIPCYLVFDYDKNSNDREIIKKSVSLLELIGENTAPPESIICNSKVTCFPKSLEKHIYNGVDDINKLKKEARKFLGIKEDSGKPLMARYIARKLTENEKPIIPKPIENLLRQAIKIKWEKSCLSNSN